MKTHALKLYAQSHVTAHDTATEDDAQALHTAYTHPDWGTTSDDITKPLLQLRETEVFNRGATGRKPCTCTHDTSTSTVAV
jgi:hypothetical protein